ncbi:MAG: hypothetical protein ACREMC_09360 [Gemmatimonadales bacterium]
MKGKERDRDWERELAEVDKLLAKLPEADPTLGRGVPTVPKTPRAGGPAGGAAPPPPAGPAGARERATTWLRVGLGLLLGIGMLAWPYSHVCGAKLLFYGIGVTTLVVAGVWSALWSWKRHVGLAHGLSLGVVLLGLVLAAGIVLPRVGYVGQEAIWFCPEPVAPPTR